MVNRGRALVRLAFFTAALCFITATQLFSQGFTSLNGLVTDPSGAIIPEATVTISNPQTGQQRQTKSDGSGRYSFQQVTPGRYKLTANATGFSDVVIESVELLVNTPSTLELKFEKIGTTTETISVEGDAAAVNTTDASLGNTIGTKPITQLPFEARNVVGLLSLQPGVTYLGEPEPGASSDYRSGTVNGGKADQGNVTLDGVDVNDQQNRNSFASVLRVTLDSVQEFRTITTNAGAEFGRTSGAQVTLVTKSGTNTVHGSLYEYLRNTATSANTFFNNASGVPRQKLNRNVYGASVGGPIKKNRLFYFLNYEGRQDASEISVVRTVPGDLFRQGIFTYTRKDGSIGQLTPAQITNIDPAHIGPSPAVLAVLQQYPHPNDSSTGDQLNTFGYRFNASAPLRYNTYIAKFDYQVDSAGRHQIFWRGNLQNDKFANTSSTGLQQFPGQAGSQILDNSKGQAIGYSWIIQPALVNNLRYGYTRQGTETTGVQTSALERFRDIDALTSRSKGLISIIPLHQISDDVSWTKGAHTVTGGFVTRFVRNNRLDFNNSFSDVLINSSFLQTTGSDLLAADAQRATVYTRQMANLLGLLTQRTGQYNYDLQGNVLPQGTGIRRKFVNNEYEMYAQDAWKLSSKLTVTYGLRLTLSPPIREGNGYQTSTNVSLEDWYNTRGYLAGSGQPQSLAPVISYDLASRPGGRPLYPYQHNFAPRFAIAYAPDSKSSIRAGFGMFYDLFGQGLIRSADATALGFSTSLQNSANAQVATVPRFTSYSNVDPSILPAAPPGGFPQTQPNIFQITNGVDDKLKAPYTMNINFSYQRDLGHGLMVQGAYVGRLSRRSLIRDDLAMPTNLRDPKSGATYFDAARQLATMINNGVPTSAVRPIPYWENLWPGAAGGGLTATQAIYDVYSSYAPDYTNALNAIDGGSSPCDPACSVFGRNAIFNAQYSSLAAFRSRGNGNYHGMQLTARKRFSQGFQFDFNYTYSKSIDLSSSRESGITDATSPVGGDAIAGQLINSWFPNLQRAVSDYDIQHNFTAFWIAEIPVGKGRHFLPNANRFVDALVGGWQVSGTFRNTSGLPVSVDNGGVWPTNWEVGSYAIQTGVVPAPHSSKNVATPGGQSGPNLFSDPAAVLAAYSSALPGDAGQRNGIRGDGFFGIDLGVGKRFTLFTLRDQPHTLQFRTETFNLTNSVRFDPNGPNININILDPNLFGRYGDVLVKPRVFQFSLRYEF
jgi:hypothetical protein